jgi:hypothetical protein
MQIKATGDSIKKAATLPFLFSREKQVDVFGNALGGVSVF